MIAAFYHDWIWPAGGSGGVPGDVFGTLVWVVIAGIVSTIVYPPIRRALEAFVKRHVTAANAEVHRKLDHIIHYHPDIPELPDQPKEPQ